MDKISTGHGIQSGGSLVELTTPQPIVNKGTEGAMGLVLEDPGSATPFAVLQLRPPVIVLLL